MSDDGLGMGQVRKWHQFNFLGLRPVWYLPSLVPRPETAPGNEARSDLDQQFVL